MNTNDRKQLANNLSLSLRGLTNYLNQPTILDMKYQYQDLLGTPTQQPLKTGQPAA